MPPAALALFAHPDDETLACGGTLHSLASRGWEVQVLFVGDGVITARGGEAQDNRDDAAEACRCLGVGEPTFVGFPDQRLDGLVVSDVINATRGAFARRPDLVLTHAGSDLNRDHRVVNHVAKVVSRPVDGPCALVECEVPGSSAWNGASFEPNWFVEIGDDLGAKLEALACYRNEVQRPPHPCSAELVEERARTTGAVAGLDAAEGLRVLRGYAGRLP